MNKLNEEARRVTSVELLDAAISAPGQARRRAPFQVITKRYERSSTIITTNIAFKDWPRIFAGDATMTSALLDRLLHHAQPVVIEADRYRSAKRKQQFPASPILNR